jgi:L-histidine N-alpha-methyltransferase
MTGVRPAGRVADPQLVADVLAGLWQSPPTLPPRWFYDETGSRLFDEITRRPEYYPSRREAEILRARAGEVMRLTDPDAMIELGSGTSTKTRLLLDAATTGGRRLTFAPLDVSAEVLFEAAAAIGSTYPTVTVRPVVGDFGEAFGDLPGEPGRRLVVFLGSTIGNFEPDARRAFLRRLRAALVPGDHLLLGADLVKDPSRLVAAYDDAAGVTAAFNRNLIEVLARELDAEGLTADDFRHVARWNAEQSRIEMWLRARRDVRAYFRTLHREWMLSAGDEMRTEISVKFQPRALRHELDACGFPVRRQWTDARGDFSLTLTVAD